VVGLEFHVQVACAAKLFSPALAAAGQPPNSCVAPFDAAMPGTLPRLNPDAVQAAAKLGFALGGEVQRFSYFERKHYTYPDLPHGYHITQQAAPIVRGGALWLQADAQEEVEAGEEELAGGRVGLRRLSVERVQLEMDTGKTSLVGGRTVVDLNRAGCALLEVVTAPELRSGSEAARAVLALQRLLRHTGVSSAALEDGSLRCDVNVSLRRAGGGLPVGDRVEVKNLNSVRSVARAVRFEALRHQRLLEQGLPVPRQTLSFDAATGRTSVMRDKETARDYRFLREPDVPPIQLSQAFLDAARAAVPELPDAARARLEELYGLTPAAAAALTAHPGTLAYFDAAVAAAAPGVDPVTVANWVIGDLVGAARVAGVSATQPPASASPERLAALLALMAQGRISGRMAKAALAAMLGGDVRPVELLCGGVQLAWDEEAMKAMVEQVLAEHPKQVSQYRGGRDRLMGLFVGQLMKRTQGRADPVAATKLFQEALGPLPSPQ
jgi:aspartyl-tRNA(Asn)/glutamyl-tRNA(Gln) amidotransferase subunit B